VRRALLLGALLLPPAAFAQEEGAGVGYPSRLRMGGFNIYSDTKSPISLVTYPGKPAGVEDIGEVKGRSCQFGLSIPLALNFRPTSISGAKGDGGYDKTLARMKKDKPELVGLYDVKVDLGVVSVLGIFRRLCVEVTARGFR
jgi:hypothetical protein